ncbi:MAG TPA: inorganic phosphate transporter [Bacteroidales bacterium]|nr:inorganic phosphate transporter [Bacteroidales bacterium]MDI9532217.1 inorganic phosphate transporter [Bacteroidota bacterium]OPZ57544.1 MAG: Sulfate permease CysP [Bacteroidetes bacterium ADurb.BinA012]MBK7731527.1 inorganic phosphate transporter [Bacteroidales bacterium]MBP7036625.1 inorganic phosphate transporter [Bacteroidales bacterium]
MFFLYLTSGLFLGWSLGANDAANIFGTAVGSKMIRFRTAALVASIFVIIGATLQGGGTTQTLSQLGSVNALPGAFTVALAAAIVVFLMTKALLPVSTTQAIVGAIIGWNLFTGNSTDVKTLTTILTTWVVSPVIGAIFSALFYILLRALLKKLQLHLIVLDVFIKWALIIVGAFGAYSLGANNIANVMGVFAASAPDVVIDMGLFRLDGLQVLFLLGGIAIALGIITYSKGLMMQVGNGIMALSAEAAIVAVFSQAVVLFIFSSTAFSEFLQGIGLPPIPLVPVSSSQVIVGSIIGIGMIKGVNEIKFKTIKGILYGWVLTPIAAGFLSFFALFFMKNLFNLNVGTEPGAADATADMAVTTGTVVSETTRHINLVWPGISLIVLAVLIIIIIYSFSQLKKRLAAEKELLEREKETIIARKALTDAGVRAVQKENLYLQNEIENKRRDLINYAMNIVEQKEYFGKIADSLRTILSDKKPESREEKLRKLELDIRQRMSFEDKVEDFNIRIERMHKDFIGRLVQLNPDLSPNDIRLAVLLRLGIATKQIATLMNISPKSVEINRYRLRKKLGLDRGSNLTQFINNI